MAATEPPRSNHTDPPVTLVNVVNNEAANRFEIRAPDGTVAELTYHLRGDRKIVLLHTGVPQAMAGHGVAGLLARAALDYARAKGLGVVVKCPYVAAFIERHPEFKDLVAL